MPVLFTFNLQTKFEMFSFIRSTDMAWTPSIECIRFLFDFNTNYVPIFYRFRDIAGYLSKVADFDPPHV